VTDPPECLACGVCCFSQLDTYVPVSGDDHARLGDHAESLVIFKGTRAYMRMVDARCAALQLDREGRFVCTVYDERPLVCRELARGSPECQGERATKADRPHALRRSRDGSSAR